MNHAFALRQNKPNQSQFMPGLTEPINTCFWLPRDLLQEKLMVIPLSLKILLIDLTAEALV